MEKNEGQSLKDRVLQYQKTGEGLREIVMTLSQTIYSYPRNKYGWEEDDCGDFFIFFFPRIICLLKNFKDQGKPFEWYLNSVLHWQFKSFIANKRRIKKSWGIAAHKDLWEHPGDTLSTESGEISLDPRIAVVLGMDSTGKIKRIPDRKRFLFLTLKYVRLLDEQAIDRLAALTGYERSWLTEIIEELKTRLYPQEERLKKFRTRQNKAFYRGKLIEEELIFEVNEQRRKELYDRLFKIRRTSRLARGEVARTPLHPSNRNIGEVLGIPKGTIDTSLFWLKKKLSMISL